MVEGGTWSKEEAAAAALSYWGKRSYELPKPGSRNWRERGRERKR